MERIQGKRECSWSNSDSSSEDSDEDMTSPYNNQPVPEVRPRAQRDPIVQPNLSHVPSRREHWQRCLVAVLKDFRKFSTQTLQRHINREWRLRGRATVLGREGNTYLIELTEDIDRNYAIQDSPWLLDGAMLVTDPWRPNTALRNVEIRYTHMWVQLWGMPLEYFQEEIAMEEVTHNLGHGIIYEVNQNHFTDDIRAYHRRRRMRNTTIIYRNGQRPNQEAGTSQQRQGAGEGDHEMAPDEIRPQQHTQENNNEERVQQGGNQKPDMQIAPAENENVLSQGEQHHQQQPEWEQMPNLEGTNDNLAPLPVVILNIPADEYKENRAIAEILAQI
ncbi:hypothetical protein CCACVL1_05081 [Corchorus capsularis]|uniref:DUF4283 domain-containing protein n=1 Tax=Corchorus capsularis TaxID=210143 RepID=A0A1R3JMQ5_COCAP|nr:hypothetical protein CCACVL1_05081 [Corchorus capsularis]